MKGICETCVFRNENYFDGVNKIVETELTDGLCIKCYRRKMGFETKGKKVDTFANPRGVEVKSSGRLRENNWMSK